MAAPRGTMMAPGGGIIAAALDCMMMGLERTTLGGGMLKLTIMSEMAC